MPGHLRRPKTAAPKFTSYRRKYPASTNELAAGGEYIRNVSPSGEEYGYNTEYEVTQGGEHFRAVPSGSACGRNSAAVQTDFDPTWSRRPRTDLGYRSYTDVHDVGTRADYKNFYQRLATDLAQKKPNLHNRFYQEPGAPVFRAGRLGAPWRHVRQCTGNMGNHICFIDDQATTGNAHNQGRGRYGPSQNLSQTQAMTGHNLMFVNSSCDATASDESPIRAGTYRSSYRAGRLGPSENVVQVTGNLGNNLAFINPMPKSERGTVKQGDMKQFPPYGSIDTQLEALSFVTPRSAVGNERTALPITQTGRYSNYTPRAGDLNRYKTSLNLRAKTNFKYWHDDVPYQGLPAKQSISGALMAKGIGC